MTDLPFGRGGSPLQNLVVRGCSQTVLTALKCVENLDAGPIYLKKPLSLSGNADEILLRAANLMSEMISTIVAEHPEPQPQEGVPTYFVRRGPADGNIGELGDLGRIFDYIRMLDGDGYPPAFLETDCLRMEFSRARLKSDELFAHVRITRKKS
jgi:methionyl-tRNA formyltransferase